jgi:hypothetical protein
MKARYVDKVFNEVAVWCKDPKKGTFALYNFTQMKIICEFHYYKKFTLNRKYMHTSLYKGERVIVVDPRHSKYVTLYDFYNRTMNRLIFQNSAKYKKIRVKKIKKFLNFDRFWLELSKE